MNTSPENYYLKHPEPYQGCLLALKQIILKVDERIMHTRKYQIPFFTYKGKSLAFLWLNRKKVILGFVTDKSVLPPAPGIRPKDQYETMQINPNEDIPKELIVAKLQELILRYN